MQFERNQLVEFTKDFPSIGIKAGDRLRVWRRGDAIPQGRHFPRGIPERYGFAEHPDVRIHGCYLKAVVDE